MGFTATASGENPTDRPPPPSTLPDGDQLLQLEQQARRSGGAVRSADLEGEWRLTSVWPKGRSRPDVLSGSLLRGLSAGLRLLPLPPRQADQPAVDQPWPPLPMAPHPHAWALENSVRLGALALVFEGTADLSGRRPLLWLRFQSWRLAWGDQVLLRRTVPAAVGQKQPFFALIACQPWSDPAVRGEQQGRWLAARGRGGGLALWIHQRELPR